MTLSVVVVDDNELAVLGLRYALERDSRFTVAGTAATEAVGLALVEELGPDLVVLDIRLPDGDGLHACRVLRDRHPDMGLVVLTMHPTDDAMVGALNAGASAYVAKTAAVESVLEAAAHAHAQPRSFSAEGLAEAMGRSLGTTRVTLTRRETELLEHLAQGDTLAEIARAMYVGESTARSHATALYRKLGVTNRSQAIMEAVRQGLLSS